MTYGLSNFLLRSKMIEQAQTTRININTPRKGRSRNQVTQSVNLNKVVSEDHSVNPKRRVKPFHADVRMAICVAKKINKEFWELDKDSNECVTKSDDTTSNAIQIIPAFTFIKKDNLNNIRFGQSHNTRKAAIKKLQQDIEFEQLKNRHSEQDTGFKTDNYWDMKKRMARLHGVFDRKATPVDYLVSKLDYDPHKLFTIHEGLPNKP